jgi:hypothetical protein
MILTAALLMLRCATPAAVVQTVPPAETNAQVLAHLSAGHLGCPPEEIRISRYQITRFERDFGELPVVESWAATCRGGTFVCSVGRGRALACSPERSTTGS